MREAGDLLQEHREILDVIGVFGTETAVIEKLGEPNAGGVFAAKPPILQGDTQRSQGTALSL